MKMIDLSDRVAVVTGGANGIGEGIAMTLAQAGADVAIVDNDRANAERVTGAIAALGRRARVVEVDLLATDAADKVADEVQAAFGRVEILVNNVGGSRQTPFLQQSERSIRRHVDLNFMSFLFLTQRLAAMMVAGGRGGAIVNVASTEALRAAPGFAVYAACKAAMVNFTRTMALELAEHHIRSHALAPDMVMTPGLAPKLGEQAPALTDAMHRYVPLNRMGSIEEVGDLVAFLVSDLSSYLNGVTLPVDGGVTAAAGWYRDPAGEWCLYHA